MANQTGPVVLFESNLEKYFLIHYIVIYKIIYVNYLSKLYDSLNFYLREFSLNLFAYKLFYFDIFTWGKKKKGGRKVYLLSGLHTFSHKTAG